MSSAYILRELARQDLEDIWIYTLAEWNLEQAEAYIGSIIDRFDWLAANPGAGKRRDDIKSGYLCFPEGSHLIFYTLSDTVIDIIDVPHQTMDVESHLTD
jgi:toxin ParE1/3/4